MSTSYWSSIFLDSDSLKDHKYFFFEFEFHAFYEKFFESKGEEYEQQLWTEKQLDLWFDVDTSTMKPNKSWKSLLHYYNFENLRNGCKNFWESNLTPEQLRLSYWEQMLIVRDLDLETKSFQGLFFLKDRFRFLSFYQLEASCGYFEYVINLKLKRAEGGNYELYTLVTLFSENLKKIVDLLNNEVHYMVRNTFTQYWETNKGALTCENILEQGNLLPSEQVAQICENYNQLKSGFKMFVFDLFSSCEGLPTYALFKIDRETLIRFCFQSDDNNLTYSKMYSTVMQEIQGIYQMPEFKVQDLALSQLFKSKMTLTENKYLGKVVYPIGLSVNSWKKNIFKNPFECSYFEDKFYLESNLLSSLSLSQIKNMFINDALFNVDALYNIVVKARKNDFSLMKSLLSLDQKYYDSLWKFIVLFVREFHLNGFFINISEKEIVQGIETDFMVDLKNKEVLMGGDPSILVPYEVGFPKNTTFHMTKFTGAGVYDQIDQIGMINNMNIIHTYVPIFNGNETSFFPYNPWKTELEISGCDQTFCAENIKIEKPVTRANLIDSFRGKSARKTQKNLNDPKKSSRNLKIYEFFLNRTIQYNFRNSTYLEEENIRLNHYDLDQKQYSADHLIYYQKELQGFFNTTNVFNSPYLISQNHQYNVDPKITQMFEYFSASGERLSPEKQRDSGYFSTEATTHKIVESKMNFHFHVQIKPSLLFLGLEQELDRLKVDQKNYFIAPLYNVEVKDSFGQKNYLQMFSTVAKANCFEKAYQGYCAVFLLVFIIVFSLAVYLFIRERKMDLLEGVDESSQSSERLVGHENLHLHF